MLGILSVHWLNISWPRRRFAPGAFLLALGPCIFQQVEDQHLHNLPAVRDAVQDALGIRVRHASCSCASISCTCQCRVRHRQPNKPLAISCLTAVRVVLHGLAAVSALDVRRARPPRHTENGIRTRWRRTRAQQTRRAIRAECPRRAAAQAEHDGRNKCRCAFKSVSFHRQASEEGGLIHRAVAVL